MAIHGASPSGLLWLVDGRGRPELEPGRLLLVPERTRGLVALLDAERAALLDAAGFLRAPEVGVSFPGTRALGGERLYGVLLSTEVRT